MKIQKCLLTKGNIYLLLSITIAICIPLIPHFIPTAHAEGEEEKQNLTIHVKNMPKSGSTGDAGTLDTVDYLIKNQGDTNTKTLSARILGITSYTSSLQTYRNTKYTITENPDDTTKEKFVYIDGDTEINGVVTELDDGTLQSDGVTIPSENVTVVSKVFLGKYTAPGQETRYNVVRLLNIQNEELKDLGSPSGINIYPVYKAQSIYHLHFDSINRISGEGAGSFDSQTNPIGYLCHTFLKPEADTIYNHYKFQYWENATSGERYDAGESVEIFNGAEEADTTVTAYAIWQPSVTVNYHVSGHQVNSEESFESISVYNYIPEDPDENTTFEGWYDEGGNRIADNMVYTAPELTGETQSVAQPLVYNVYAMFSQPQDDNEESTTPSHSSNDDDPSTIISDDDTISSELESQEESGNYSTDSIETGDETNLFVWTIIMLTSGIYMFTKLLFVYNKKSYDNNESC